MSPKIQTNVKKKGVKIRVGLVSPSKGGKTLTALSIAFGYNPITGERSSRHLVKGRVGIIDTEPVAPDSEVGR